jgi:AraC-like DNA-binding protein
MIDDTWAEEKSGMDGAQLSRFPHHSWLSIFFQAPPSNDPWVFNSHGSVHAIHLTIATPHATRWITQGRELQWHSPPGQVHFLPADDQQRTLLAPAPFGYESFKVLLPRQHLRVISVEDGVDSAYGLHRLLCDNDRVLVSCMVRLSVSTPQNDSNLENRKDEAARRLVLRLFELCGGGTPDWHADSSVFERRTLERFVEYIDEHLKIAPTLSDMALLAGISPSHFARKFRLTTGVSLYRFINRRRIQRSLEVLLQDSTPLASVAMDLGFSSQSHFTRLFSDLTGSTPAKFRRQYMRVTA